MRKVTLTVLLMALVAFSAAAQGQTTPETPAGSAAQAPVESPAAAPIEPPELVTEPASKQPELPALPDWLAAIPTKSLEDLMPQDGPASLSKEQVTRSVFGFVVLLVLAYLAGHPRLTALEERLPIGAAAITSFLFVLLGLFAANGSVSVLTGTVVQAIKPVVPFCLGWYGFRHGFGYSQELLLKPPAGSAVVLFTLAPLVIAVGGSGAFVALWAPEMLRDRAVWRDLVVFGLACGTTALATTAHLERLRPGLIRRARLEGLIKMEHLVTIALLMLLPVYFRPNNPMIGWQLPESAWLFIVFGVGSSMGILSWALFRTTPEGPPFIVVLIGSVALCAGMASFLRLAVVPVCFIAGLIVAGLPGANRGQVRAVLDRMQRPALFVLLVIAGAIWQPSAWQGWVLLLVFLAARLAGNRLATGVLRRRMPDELNAEESRALSFAPAGALSLAIILTGRDLYPDTSVPYTLTAVIIGMLLGDVLLQSRYWRRAQDVKQAGS